MYLNGSIGGIRHHIHYSAVVKCSQDEATGQQLLGFPNDPPVTMVNGRQGAGQEGRRETDQLLSTTGFCEQGGADVYFLLGEMEILKYNGEWLF